MGLGRGMNEAGESRQQHNLRKKIIDRLTIFKAAEYGQTIRQEVIFLPKWET